MEAMPRQCGREANEFALPKRIGLIDLFDWTFSVGRDTCHEALAFETQVSSARTMVALRA